MTVEVESGPIINNPHCVHGPTILFSRIVNGEKRKFFACSACRDRKDCSFFLWEDELPKYDSHKSKVVNDKRSKYMGNINHEDMCLTFSKIRKLPQSQRCYCRTCSCFLLPTHEDKHSHHQVEKDISDYSLNHPTEFLEPLDNSKKEAQYLFSKLSVKTIVTILLQKQVRNVICIGTPRIHEYILNDVPNMNTLLLDIDKRYHSFYGPLKFCWYNCFNNHFFLSENTFKKFINNKSVDEFIILTDPPFGGRIELLANSLKKINKLFQQLNKTDKELKIMWIFPYFMEPQILNSLPHFKMLDYKVDYENHPLFQDGPKGRKQGSPVRIFTNIDPSTITLPADQGYKYCKKCSMWVANENKHCEFCNYCTSKDGRTYIHCVYCKRCVKPTWTHCNTCNRCTQINHKCGVMIFNKECFHCKQEGHKKRDCPNVDHEELKRKRKDGIKVIRRKHKKKKVIN